MQFDAAREQQTGIEHVEPNPVEWGKDIEFQEHYLRALFNFDEATWDRLMRKDEPVQVPDQENSFESVVIHGIGEVQFDSLDVEKLLIGTFPKNWMIGNVDTISLTPGKVVQMPEEYGIESTAAGANIPKEDKRSQIQLYQHDLKDIVLTIDHESGHANDWGNERHLAYAERVQLLQDVTQRFLLGDSLYHSDYVEAIDNPDKHIELYLKVSEYWAELCAAYFSHAVEWEDQVGKIRVGHELNYTHPKDFVLVDNWVHRIDPDFVWENHWSEQDNIVSGMVNNRAWDSIPPELQNQLLQFADTYGHKVFDAELNIDDIFSMKRINLLNSLEKPVFAKAVKICHEQGIQDPEIVQEVASRVARETSDKVQELERAHAWSQLSPALQKEVGAMEKRKLGELLRHREELSKKPNGAGFVIADFGQTLIEYLQQRGVTQNTIWDPVRERVTEKLTAEYDHANASSPKQ